MTKSTITRERAQQIFLGNGPEPSASEERELARMARAAMDSEPVAEITEDLGRLFVKIHYPTTLKAGDKLYRHAHQTAVPDIDELRLVFESAERELDDGFNLHKYGIGYADDATQGRWEVWLSCRAAMLAAAPHDTPALNSVQSVDSVADRWIPVSERMPEDEQEVLTINKMGHRFVSFFDKHSGLFFDRLDAPAACCIEHVLVTHWMPLPAAPQEVKGE
ncbi:DUF551 domain-containing protein [Klebsiella pneumoniae]|nr:DUF551 domain-containing protein [Klebsiella pneumoniae]